jgi:hypothetical protein
LQRKIALDFMAKYAMAALADVAAEGISARVD